jgi:hypothetical protein
VGIVPPASSRSSCGGFVCGARMADGSGLAWGDAAKGVDCNSDVSISGAGIMDGTTSAKTVVDMSCGGNVCVARMADGTGRAWGNPAWGGIFGIDQTAVIQPCTDGSFLDLPADSCIPNSCAATTNAADDGSDCNFHSINGGGASVATPAVALAQCAMRDTRHDMDTLGPTIMGLKVWFSVRRRMGSSTR